MRLIVTLLSLFIVTLLSLSLLIAFLVFSSALLCRISHILFARHVAVLLWHSFGSIVWRARKTEKGLSLVKREERGFSLVREKKSEL